MRRLEDWLRDHWLIGTTGAVLLVLALTWSARVFLWASIPYRGYGASYVIIEIPEGTGALRAIEILEEHEVIQRSPLAMTYLRMSGRTRGLKAGEYSFTRPMTPGEVFDKLISGDVYYHKVTIPEGVRSDEVFTQFVRSGFGPEEEFREAFHDTSLIEDFDSEATDLEGYLFPDTYTLQKGTPPKTIIATMVARFREVFQPSWIEKVRQRGLTVREATTLASMVEWETAQSDENALVASVFYNRLRLGMRLQCDPTVIYALAMRNQFDGNIRKDDLKIDSLYNTYRYFGLPPGPIGNPGSASLLAAVEPAETRYLYFVSMNTGRHYFSTTLTEHNKAVWQYQVRPFRRPSASRSPAGGRGN
jgi:peptidoglycan lytic transglycosylase G